MNKPRLLRSALSSAVPYLRDNPDRLHVFVESGTVVGTLAPSLSWEYRYTLTLIVTDYAGNEDLLVAPVQAWLREYQPDLLANPEKQEKGFEFEAEILDNGTVDIRISLKLTERIQVRNAGGNQVVAPLPEPSEPDDYWIDRRG
ncbi:phage tail protein [Dickeya dianthicola]|uniref:phage tail protein n=1 Tax=Dickeya dianthicola TaxID=204039 RepID=UPI001868AE6D|nr:phage tail protein [Dickeya dianthicola]QOL13292.1 phage tail protein [Dickeya dianthicola]